jgi:hypothetical protein
LSCRTGALTPGGRYFVRSWTSCRSSRWSARGSMPTARPAGLLHQLDPLLLRRPPLIRRDRHILMLDLKPEPVEEAHIHIGHPDQRKLRHQVPPPPRIQHLEPHHHKEKRSHIVREAVFAREQVKELPLHHRLAGLALLLAELPRLAKHLFMRHRPRHARDWNRQKKQKPGLLCKWQHGTPSPRNHGSSSP